MTMSKQVEIHIAELYAGDEDFIITTSGVGSCIVIVLYDRLMRIGGMAHAILPRKRTEDTPIQFRRDESGKVFA